MLELHFGIYQESIVPLISEVEDASQHVERVGESRGAPIVTPRIEVLVGHLSVSADGHSLLDLVDLGSRWSQAADRGTGSGRGGLPERQPLHFQRQQLKLSLELGHPCRIAARRRAPQRFECSLQLPNLLLELANPLFHVPRRCRPGARSGSMGSLWIGWTPARAGSGHQ